LVYIAQRDAIASATNTNLRGDRPIEKVLPEARSTSNGYPSNRRRLVALLKFFKATNTDEGSAPTTIADEDVEAEYDVLKVYAGRQKALLLDQYPRYKDSTWADIGKEEPSIQKNAILALEKKAFDGGFPLHLCQEMWAADRLLFEAFRSSSKPKNSNSGSE
jgi:hypothetical protein